MAIDGHDSFFDKENLTPPNFASSSHINATIDKSPEVAEKLNGTHPIVKSTPDTFVISDKAPPKTYSMHLLGSDPAPETYPKPHSNDNGVIYL